MENLKKTGNLVVRADASREIGIGHVMRQVALAQEWQMQGGRAEFVMARPNPPIEERLLAEGFRCHCLEETPASQPDCVKTRQLAEELEADAIVLDGYQFGTRFQECLSRAGKPMLVVDDYNYCSRFHADLILNQNPHASTGDYRASAPNIPVLLGPRYTLLRQDIRKHERLRSKPRNRCKRNILVTMGGADPDNVTETVLRVLLSEGSFDGHFTVIVGNNNAHQSELTRFAERYSDRITLLPNVVDMGEVLLRTDIAVSAGGATVWELAYFGIPMAVVTLAENQRPIVEWLQNQGIARPLGWYGDLNWQEAGGLLVELCRAKPSELEEISSRARRIMDGCGPSRVVAALRGLGQPEFEDSVK